MPDMNMIKSLNSALSISLKDDPNVVIFGEDVGYFGGVFRVTEGLQKEYGPHRVFDSPLAEGGIAAIAIALSALVILFADIIGKGHTAFIKTTVTLEVDIDGEAMYLDDASDERQMKMADFVEPLIRALMKEIPEASR